MRMFFARSLTTLVIVAATAPIARPQSAQRTDPVLTNCQVQFVDDIEIPATEAGVLVKLNVKPGSQVLKDEEIGQIDDRVPHMEKTIAEQQYRAVVKQMESDIDKKYAVKAAEVAWEDYLELKAAVEGGERIGIQSVVQQTEVRRAKLEHERALLQAEKADHDKAVMEFDKNSRLQEYYAAKLAIERRVIKAPFDGEVLKVFRKQSEWVNPGDSILRFVRYDTLQVDGQVYLDEYDPRALDGCEATIECTVGVGRTVQARGQIVLVEQLVEYEGRYTYLVRAKVPNRLEEGRWVLLPGLQATMTIHLDTRTPVVSRRR